jgi:glycine/D-amino acid oxidase-like deaminating enzyme
LNGIERWPNEYQKLRQLGEANLKAIRDFVHLHKIDCDWRDAGEVEVATEQYQVQGLKNAAALAASYGEVFSFENAEQVKSRLNSPKFLAANFEPETVAMVNPAQLAQGLAKVAIDSGVQIFENSVLTKMAVRPNAIEARVNQNLVRAKHIVLATNAYRSPIAKVRRRIVPVFDYQLATEVIPTEKWNELGWDGFEGFRDAGNQFHYFRRTADNRILFGGYDAVYYFKNQNDTNTEHNEITYAKLAEHFFDFFPQLEGTKFEYKWGGAIDTCSRFAAFWGTAYRNRLAYVAGYTGLGVGASRFGAQVMLDMLYEPDSELLKLEMVRTKPIPFPPEPIRWLVIKLTQVSLAKADTKQGRRNLWLRLLDLLGLGFDS